jgi:hypothetical protein
MQTQGIKLHKAFLPPVWRILVFMALLQLCGAVYVVSQGFFPGFLQNVSYGAALATPTGFIFGFIWQAANSRESVLEHLPIIGFLLFLSLLVSGMTFFYPIN